MIDHVFEFEEGKMPAPVWLATAGLIVLFVLGIAYRLITYVAF